MVVVVMLVVMVVVVVFAMGTVVSADDNDAARTGVVVSPVDVAASRDIAAVTEDSP